MRVKLISLLVALLGLAAGAAQGQPETRSFITVAEVVRLRAQGAPVVLVDVRTREEYRARHIKGAESIPLSTIREREVILPRNVPVVLY
jgi:rhodanese-related sulfurtransferase